MSPGVALQIAGWIALCRSNGRQMGLLTDVDPLPLPFHVVPNKAPMIDPRTELGGDGRELMCVQGIQAGLGINYCGLIPVPDAVAMNSFVQDGTNRLKVVKRENNPSDFTVDFWMVKVTDQDT